MMKSAAVTALLLFIAGGAFPQTPRPGPTPPAADETDIVKITTTLIQLDVTVTDKKGKIISDLRPDEIEIFENGKKQTLSNFSFISNVRSSTVNTDAKAVPLPPSAIRPEQVRRTIALVVDDLTLSFTSTFWVRKALKKFVDEQMQDGDLVAIIRTGAGIGALQQFTNDKRQLYAAIERVRWNSLGAGNVGTFAPLEARALSGDDSEPEPGERTPEGMEREFNDFRESLFATGTLGAINYVVRGMRELPGRKSVMLLSDGFRLFTRDASGSREYGRVMDSLRRLVDMANRASVVIYTMDARGLEIGGLTAADDVAGYSFDQVNEAISERREELLDTQEGLRYLARQTGGIAIINNNDLSWGIRRILDDHSYYLVAYQPDDATFDPRTRRFNKLEVRVTRPGARVRYRSGFFGVSDEKLVAPQQTPEQRLMHALTSPFAVSNISLRLNALYYYSASTGNMIRSLVHINGRDLAFIDQPDGSKKAVFDLVAIGVGDNGMPMDQVGKSYTLVLKKDMYEQVMKHGFVYQFQMRMKKPGAYQLRLALRDHATNKIGSAHQFVEVPNVKKNRLVLSGVVLETMNYADWQRRSGSQSEVERQSDPLADTALRQFKSGRVLNYGLSVYNAKPGPSGRPDLTYQIRIFRDGHQIFEGQRRQVELHAGSDLKSVNFSSGLVLGGAAMLPGDYVLQIVVTDKLRKPDRNSVMQFVQFEIVE